MKADESRTRAKAEPPSFANTDLVDDLGSRPMQLADARGAATTLPCVFCTGTACPELASAKKHEPLTINNRYRGKTTSARFPPHTPIIHFVRRNNFSPAHRLALASAATTTTLRTARGLLPLNRCVLRASYSPSNKPNPNSHLIVVCPQIGASYRGSYFSMVWIWIGVFVLRALLPCGVSFFPCWRGRWIGVLFCPCC